MRTLGLIGGMSWESTAIYYRGLNEGAKARLGALSSAPLVLCGPSTSLRSLHCKQSATGAGFQC